MSRRPPPVFLTARWRHLAMLNYEVDPAILASRVPAGTELDLRGGRCFLSLVGFQFRDTRVLGVPIPGHRHFEEVNLRFYVVRVEGGETRRGVVFVKEIVPRRAIAWAARTLYEEPYVALPMGHRDTIGEDGGSVDYRWELGDPQELRAVVEGPPSLPGDDSDAAWFVEHYWGYTALSDGGTREYRVEHPPWRVWNARVELTCDVATLYGRELAGALGRPPHSALVAEGSEIAVRWGRRI